MEWYERIKELRLAHNMTQQELAEAAGYSDRSSIAKIERGVNDVPQSKLEVFSKVLGVTPSYIMGSVEDVDMVKVKDHMYELNEEEEHMLAKFNELDDHHKELLAMYLDVLCIDNDK